MPGLERSIAGNGTYTDGQIVSTGYLLSSSGPCFFLNDLNGGAGPAHLLIGGADPDGTDSAANGSIAGNKPHNAFLDETAIFSIRAAGVTASTSITGVAFSFGTSSGLNVAGVPLHPQITPSVVPEPSAALLTLTGLGPWPAWRGGVPVAGRPDGPLDWAPADRLGCRSGRLSGSGRSRVLE